MTLVEQIKDLVEPLVIDSDCYLEDIEYVLENNEWYLKIYIEKNIGNLDMDTCVKVSELISQKLDEIDPIKDEYYLEVSSPGIERPIKSLEKVKDSIGEYVYVKLLNPKAGLNEFEGYIDGVDDEDITFRYLVKNIKKSIVVNYSDIKFIRFAVKF